MVVVVSACGGDGDDGSGASESAGDGDVVVNEDVVVLGEEARAELEGFELDTDRNEGEIAFVDSSSFAADVEVGRILVTEPVEGTAPYGFLQRVESKRTENGRIVFTTSQATLLETFNRADIRYEQRLDPADLIDAETRTEGIELRTSESPTTRRQPLGFDFGLEFDQVLVDADGDHSTTEDQLTLDGSVNFNASAKADIDIGWFAELDLFLFRIDLEESASVEIAGSAGYQFDERITVASYQFGTFTIFVGPVPVVFNITMTVDVGADGTFEANVSAKAVQETSVTLGAKYTENNGWENLNDFDSSFSFSPPEITVAGAARAFAEPRIAVKIYGLAGPFVLAQAYVAADAELYRSPFWRFTAGLDFGVGFVIELPVVGEVARYQKNFAGFEEELGVAPNAEPTLEVLSPEDGKRLLDGSPIHFELVVGDLEQEQVDVAITDGGGNTVAEDRIGGSSPSRLVSDPVCIGSHTYRITATDDDGASVSETISVVAENRPPEVSVDRGTAPSPFPGGYLVAFADATDLTCETRNAAEQDLIGWYANGNRVGSTDELLYRVSPSEFQAGDTFPLEARYDDGQAVGHSQPIEISVIEKPPGADIEPTPIIRRPVDGRAYTTTGAPLPFEGLGIDTEDGELSTSSLLWEIEKGGGWYELGRTKSGTIDHFDIFEGVNAYGTHRVRLTVTDSADQTTSTIVTYDLHPEG